MLKERIDGRITLSEPERVAQAMHNASVGQPAHFQVYLNLALLPVTAAATSDCGCSALVASSKMLYQLLCAFLSAPIGTAVHLAHAQRLYNSC